MRTEDHPLDYLTWEGVIPKGEYGGGEMIVWDRGVYQNISKTRSGREMTIEEALEKGDIKVFFLGEKIKGAYALVRTSDPGDREQEDRGEQQQHRVVAPSDWRGLVAVGQDFFDGAGRQISRQRGDRVRGNGRDAGGQLGPDRAVLNGLRQGSHQMSLIASPVASTRAAARRSSSLAPVHEPM